METTMIDKKWIVQFEDGYMKRYTNVQLRDILILKRTEKIGRQLDYVLVST